ncbi:N-acetylmuramoyl-L-alanine amidase [Kordiimonas sediminis]|uniref:N-acetylmuramoyl-L-alanine amidase n=1 Tax=Kordiimonas sediminis TaxID=1735581 RepID=A0A919E9E0_9PROT|nr:N-acetylmuramoyl-L-alanine amidase [Kordiimonas sediminis]GHF27441.1 N-acetylmuramoyl-L-alanine amidase [Kordiimonas sediminis]
MGVQDNGTRFVIDLSETTDPRVFLLENPQRIVIDLPNAKWNARGGVKAMGDIRSYRHGQFTSNIYRIVLDLKRPVIVSDLFHLPAKGQFGPRLVIDLEQTSTSRFAQAVADTKQAPLRASNAKQFAKATPSASQPKSTQPAQQSQRAQIQQSAKHVIVLDPGHGGKDPGTIGVLGVNEEVIVLNMAREIKRELEATGRYKVHLTRDRDIYIPHRQRYEMAQRLEADLFVSIHADAIENKDVRGGTVYTLNDKASDDEARRLAARENKSDLIAGVVMAEYDNEVQNILVELAQRETLNLSAQLAEFLVPEMRRDIKMHKRAHRYASLMVLKSPTVPSILVETGYLSNKTDAKLLNTKSYQRKVGQAMVRAFDKYFGQMRAMGR